MTASDISSANPPPAATGQDRPVFLMCRPDFYAILPPDRLSGHPNDFAKQGHEEYSKDRKGFVEKAQEQWLNLRGIFNALGVEVVTLEPREDLPDQVFTADASISFSTGSGAVVLLSKFSNEARQPEVAIHKAFMDAQFPGRTIVEAEHCIEGTGDNIYDPHRNMFWSGYTKVPGRANAASGRSDIEMHKTLRDLTGTKVISMLTTTPFYHIDTVMAPLSRGDVLVYPQGMTGEALDILARIVPTEKRIIVSPQDAFKFACNVRCVGNTVVMPACSQALQDAVRERDYEVSTADISQFIYSGGGIHCMTNNLREHHPGPLPA